ncbi:hypothetical protein [Denitromonas halophila]|uniref:DUF4376 domain-containing protein n=1 Tax=Denitromonas halophila TaxID=1629404 RepID=A0A557QX70_9RHOO|nr:hypothetical protein [Denitromonas halophila]TVO57514.1 hypothetical protein FHP91_07505 [Denitromonas halophila]
MDMHYSASAGGFYSPSIHAAMPPDAVAITPAEHLSLLYGQSIGKIIAADLTGAPTLIDPPPPTFEEMKESKRADIRAAYALSAEAPVIADGVTWDGGFDSAIKLDAAKRLAESAGLSDVTFYSSDNLPHVLSFSAALQIVIAVAGAFQSALATKQTLMRAIDDAADTDELALVVWP